MLFAFFRDNVDHAAGIIEIDKAVADGAVQDFNALDGHYGRSHIQVVGGASVGKTAFDILFPSVDEYGDPVIAVDADDLMIRVDRTGGDGYAGGVGQGFRNGFIMIVFHFFRRDDSSKSRGLHQKGLGNGAVGIRLADGRRQGSGRTGSGSSFFRFCRKNGKHAGRTGQQNRSG